MKNNLVLLYFVLFAGLTAAQSYPLVTLHDINYIANQDTLPFFPSSPLAGDTVRVRGVVTVRTLVGSEQPGVGDRRPVIWVGSGWACYIQDKDNPEWGGIQVYQGDSTSAAAQQTLLDLADTARVYEFTGVVTPYFQSTELVLITTPSPVPIEEIEVLPQRPNPTPLTIDSLFASSTKGNYLMRKYQGTYVEFKADASHNLITSDRVTGTGSTSGNFRLNDGTGKSMMVYAQSTYFKTNSSGIRPTYQSPVNGTYLSYLRGILTMRSDAAAGVLYWLVPLYPDDLGSALVIPPSISSVGRDAAIAAPNQAVTVSCVAKGVQANIQSVKLFYRLNDGAQDSLDMVTTTTDSIYSGTIPGVALDSALVEYYIKATDLNGVSITNPSNLSTSRYFYFVLNRPITIREVQYSPFGSGLSAFYNYSVTVSGIVTADTVGRYSSAGNGAPSSSNRIILQDGETPWSGIWLNAANTNQDVYGLKKGDNVTITGVIREDFDVTRIDSISSLIIHSSNNSLPNTQILTTGSIGTKASNVIDAEQWESVLIKFENVNVTDLNADGNAGPDQGSGGNRNFGEIFVNDGSGNVRVDLQDGNHLYHNMWDASLAGNLTLIIIDSGATIASLSGYLYFSFSYYKLIPRMTTDFVGYTPPVGINDGDNTIPDKFVVEQNYPNPFNPSTVISYSLPKEGLVNIRIYNSLGQEVANLFNAVQRAGVHKINFDASYLSSGVYFYLFTSDNFSQAKKMILLK